MLQGEKSSKRKKKRIRQQSKGDEEQDKFTMLLNANVKLTISTELWVFMARFFPLRLHSLCKSVDDLKKK